MTDKEIDALALSIRNQGLLNKNTKSYIRKCIAEGNTTDAEIEACTKLKIAQEFKKNLGDQNPDKD